MKKNRLGCYIYLWVYYSKQAFYYSWHQLQYYDSSHLNFHQMLVLLQPRYQMIYFQAIAFYCWSYHSDFFIALTILLSYDFLLNLYFEILHSNHVLEVPLGYKQSFGHCYLMHADLAFAPVDIIYSSLDIDSSSNYLEPVAINSQILIEVDPGLIFHFLSYLRNHLTLNFLFEHFDSDYFLLLPHNYYQLFNAASHKLLVHDHLNFETIRLRCNYSFRQKASLRFADVHDHCFLDFMMVITWSSYLWYYLWHFWYFFGLLHFLSHCVCQYSYYYSYSIAMYYSFLWIIEF